MKKIQPVRGTHDLFGDSYNKKFFIEKEASNLIGLYGYNEIETPILEYLDVFTNSLGVASDIVSKEMFTLTTSKGNQIALRPEGTAGVARAFVSNGLAQFLPLKLFYKGPMFRRERPQKGRLRQFHQIGIEYLGDNSFFADIEVISIANKFLHKLGLSEKFKLEINSLGDLESRESYTHDLKRFLKEKKKDLSYDSLMRLDKNPLRILDSKDKNDIKILTDAPVFSDYLNSPSKEFYTNLKLGLDDLGIEYIENPKLVRGLDYYCHTAFEFISNQIGSQGTILAGGRYDGLIHRMGGNSTSGVGWAAGIERLSLLIKTRNLQNKTISIIFTSNKLLPKAFALAEQLRSLDIKTDIIFSGNIKKQLKRANKVKSFAAIIVGEDELINNNIILKDLSDSSQKEIKIDNLIEEVKKIL